MPIFVAVWVPPVLKKLLLNYLLYLVVIVLLLWLYRPLESALGGGWLFALVMMGLFVLARILVEYCKARWAPQQAGELESDVK